MGIKCCKTNSNSRRPNKSIICFGLDNVFKSLSTGHDLVLWVQLQVDIMATKLPNASWFIEYLKNHWMHKTTMWCVGNCKIPHARQDTDVAMESFHNNMKQIFMSFREWFTRCRLDWLIFHLVGNVFTHYWYDVQCKLFRYVRRKKKGIVASTVLRVRDILDSNVC
jgi:hypothetical protein